MGKNNILNVKVIDLETVKILYASSKIITDKKIISSAAKKAVIDIYNNILFKKESKK